MAIVASDIKFRLSTTSGSQGNSTAGTIATSLGKYASTTDIADGVLNNLFDDVSGSENTSLDVEYRCLFVYNSHATLTYQNAVAWMDSQVVGGADCALGLDPTASSGVNATSAQAIQAADENTAPGGVTFLTTPVTRASGLAVGNVGPGQVKGVWLRRSATNSAPLASDGVTLAVSGDTAA